MWPNMDINCRCMWPRAGRRFCGMPFERNQKKKKKHEMKKKKEKPERSKIIPIDWVAYLRLMRWHTTQTCKSYTAVHTPQRDWRRQRHILAVTGRPIVDQAQYSGQATFAPLSFLDSQKICNSSDCLSVSLPCIFGLVLLHCTNDE